MVNSQPRSTPSEPIFPAVRLASQRDLFVAGIRRRYFSPIIRTMRRSDATREPLWQPRSARDTAAKGARWCLEALTKGASVPLVHTLAARRELVHADGPTAASSTRGTVMVACCSPSRSRRRRPRPLRPSAARAAGFRRPSLPWLKAQARAAPPATAALAVALRRGHALLGARLAFPRRELPRPLLLRAARVACSYCVSLRAPQARGPDGCSSVSGLLAGWSGSCRAIRHVEPVCSTVEVTLLKKEVTLLECVELNVSLGGSSLELWLANGAQASTAP